MGNLLATRDTRLEIPEAYADHFREYLDWVDTPEALRAAKVAREAAKETIEATR